MDEKQIVEMLEARLLQTSREQTQALLEASQKQAEGSIRVAIATENFTKVVAEWKELLTHHDQQAKDTIQHGQSFMTHQSQICDKCHEILPEIKEMVKSVCSTISVALDERARKLSWWQIAITPITIAIIGSGGAIVAVVVQYILKVVGGGQ